MADINELFENRVDEYKKNGFKIIKRLDNSVEMGKSVMDVSYYITLAFVLLFSLVGVFLFFFVNWIVGLFVFIIALFSTIFCGLASAKKVVISITKTGKIEESGYTLEK